MTGAFHHINNQPTNPTLFFSVINLSVNDPLFIAVFQAFAF